MNSPNANILRLFTLTATFLAITGAHSQLVGDGDGGHGHCVEDYGFLPCSTNAWGLLFMVLVYEILLSIASQYVGRGSELFFKLIGSGIFGNSLFQMLSTIPQIVLVLVGSLSVPNDLAEQQAVLGVGLVVGSTVMLLTLVWGLTVIVGSYDLAKVTPTDEHTERLQGYGVITDVETCFTARLVLISTIPILFLVPATAISSLVGQGVVVLIALIITILLFIAYFLSQIFQPWVHERRFDYLMRKYKRDRLLTLLSTNGRPDANKIQRFFDSIDRDKSGFISASELGVLLLGVKIDDDDLNTEKDIEDILQSFDTTVDGRIDRNEFLQAMTKLISDGWEKSPSTDSFSKSQNGESNQPLLSTGGHTVNRSNILLQYGKALFLVIVATAAIMLLATPLSNNVSGFAQAVHLPQFLVPYFIIPLALNYGVAYQSIMSATQRSRKSISLTLSSLYGTVYMNNIVGLISFLVPVYVRDLPINLIAEAVIVFVVCLLMSCVGSFYTKFPRWVGYAVLLFYVVSLALIYLLTSVFHLP